MQANKWIALLLAAVMAMSLCACGASAADDSPEASPENSSESVPESPANAQPSDEIMHHVVHF